MQENAIPLLRLSRTNPSSWCCRYCCISREYDMMHMISPQTHCRKITAIGYGLPFSFQWRYMSAVVSQTTGNWTHSLTICLGLCQRKHHSPRHCLFVWEYPHTGPVTLVRVTWCGMYIPRNLQMIRAFCGLIRIHLTHLLVNSYYCSIADELNSDEYWC